MDKYIQFYNQVNGQSVEAEDPTALDQCMDEIFKYLDLLGIDRASIRRQYAYQVWTTADDLTKKYFDLYPNTPDFVPNVGDIAVFKQCAGIPLGHISIVAPGSNINDLVTLDQNWDTPHYHHLDAQGNWIPYCRIVVHYQYYGCVGFLRAKNQPTGEDVLLNKLQAIINGSGTPHDKITQARTLLTV